MLDGKPIVAIATDRTKNRKTGDMIQTWILRADQDPLAAVFSGADSSICGDCRHRGKNTKAEPRTCYVTVAQAPLGIWRKWKSGGYPKGPLPTHKPVRMGAYGDPVAVPWQAWTGLHSANLWTGYTHQWRQLIASPFRNVLMASCDSEQEEKLAQLMGWRTFRVMKPGTTGTALECPSNKGAQCAHCGLCSGLNRPDAPSVWIEAHGTAKAFV
jgi:hypothetical protein